MKRRRLFFTRLKYKFVDLGLPSGILWCTTNLGTITPEGSGLFYSWGNIEGHNVGYLFNTENYSSTPGKTLTTDIPKDNATYDAVTAALGNKYRIPAKEDFLELLNNTTQTWTTVNGVNGVLFTSTVSGYTDKSIFIPAVGYCDANGVNQTYNEYINSNSSSNNTTDTAYCLVGSSSSTLLVLSDSTKSLGKPLRPIYDPYAEYVFSLYDTSTSTSTTTGFTYNAAALSGNYNILNNLTSTKSGSAWGFTASSNVNWITIDSSTKNLSWSENSAQTTRTGVVTFTLNTTGKTIVMTITQAASVYTFSAGTTSLSPTYASGSTNVTITTTKNGSTLGYTASSNLSWLTYSINGTTLTVNYAENNGASSRSGTITLTLNISGKTATITVTLSDGYVLSSNVSSRTLSNSSGSSSTFSITTTHKGSYTAISATTSTSWLSVSLSGSSSPITVTVSSTSSNASSNSRRTGSITITLTVSGKTLNLTVYLSGASFSFSLYSGDTSYSPDYGSGSVTLLVTSKKNTSALSFTAYSSVSWLTYTLPSSWSSSTGGNTVTINYSANSDLSSRTGYVTLTQGNSGNTITIYFTQAGKPIIATVDLNGNQWVESTTHYSTNYSFSFKSDSNYHVANASATMYLTVDTACTMYYRNYSQSSYDYVTIYNDSTNTLVGTRKGYTGWGPINLAANTKYRIVYSKNATTNSYDDRAYISLPTNTIYAVTNYVFTCSTSSDSFNASSDSNSANVTSTKDGNTQSFSVSTDLSWLHATAYSSYVSYSVDENLDSSSRSGTVTLTQSESGNTLTIDITLSGASSNFYSVCNGVGYYWTCNGNTYTTTNQSFDNTTAVLLLDGNNYKYDGSLTWSVSSEQNYDKLTILIINDSYSYASSLSPTDFSSSSSYDTRLVYEQSGSLSGTIDLTNYSLSGKTLVFIYSKDSSSSSGTDTAEITITGSSSASLTFDSKGICNIDWVKIASGTVSYNGGFKEGSNLNLAVYHSGSTSDSGYKTIIFNTSYLPYNFLYYEVSSEANYDYIRFYGTNSTPTSDMIDGLGNNKSYSGVSEINKYSGYNSNSYFLINTKGQLYYGNYNYVIVLYTKDSSSSGGTDKAWVSIRSELETWGWAQPLGTSYFAFYRDDNSISSSNYLCNIKLIPSGTTFRYCWVSNSYSSASNPISFWDNGGTSGIDLCTNVTLKCTNSNYADFDTDNGNGTTNVSYSTTTIGLSNSPNYGNQGIVYDNGVGKIYILTATASQNIPAKRFMMHFAENPPYGRATVTS